MSRRSHVVLTGVMFAVALAASAQSPPAKEAQPAPPALAAATIDQLGWLQGCWDGKVNQRDFREEWLPLRGEMMIGASQTVLQGKTQDFEYLRLEVRPDGVYYVAVPSGKKESPFRLKGKSIDGDDEVFVFENTVDEFPQRILYRHGTKGWLYAHVEGAIGGQEKKVIYPMRRVDCQTGELITN